MNDTLFRSDPAQLAVGDEVAPGLTPVGGEFVEVFADDEGSEEGDGGADDFVAAADGEGLGLLVSGPPEGSRIVCVPCRVRCSQSQCR